MSTEFRRASPADHPKISEAIQTWWRDSRTPEQARELSLMIPRVFLEHFSSTSTIVTDRDGLAGFLVGFLSQDHADAAYIHFVGVRPDLRGHGLARKLYEDFFDTVRAAGRTVVRAVTSPRNTNSIAFHRHLGFEVRDPEEGDIEQLARMARTLG